jgi:hypothetical protein
MRRQERRQDLMESNGVLLHAIDSNAVSIQRKVSV